MRKHLMTRQQALEDLSAFGITRCQIYLLDIIPLIEMMWADGILQPGEIAMLDEYLRRRVQQVNEMAGFPIINFHDARAFADRFTQERPPPEVLGALRSMVGPVILSSSDSRYVDSLLRLLVETCIDIAANAVRSYPYGAHDRFDSEEKKIFLEILKTFIEFKRPDMETGCR